MVNASPDIALQLRSYACLAPSSDSPRKSPISAVFLSSADVDHVLGLISLREGGAMQIYAPPAIRASATKLGVDTVLGAFGGVEWHEVPFVPSFPFLPLTGSDGKPSNLQVRTIPLTGKAPRYAGKMPDGTHTVAYQFLDSRTGGKTLVAPGLGELSANFREAAESSDAVFVDGTFWSDRELQTYKPEAATARGMSHLPISDGTLPYLSGLSARHRVYIHINNTNPIFDANSVERKAVEAAGVTVGADGMMFDI